jgi:hypothetical protein
VCDRQLVNGDRVLWQFSDSRQNLVPRRLLFVK